MTNTQPLLESEIIRLEREIIEAKSIVQSWVDANAGLSRSAAEARAKNQGAGRGLMGGLLGSKYRAAVRAGAAASNAAIAREVAANRASIAEGKRTAQQALKDLQHQLAESKRRLKAESSSATQNRRVAKASSDQASAVLDLMHKLKEAFDAGVLTQTEYEAKRQSLLSKL